MPLHALELLPDRAGQLVIRRDWRLLCEAGLRSQLEHRGATNAPHLTLVAAAAIDPPADALAVDLIAPLLPIRVRCSGILLLGTRRLTVARVVDVEDHVVTTALRLRAAVDGPEHPGWLPHLTLARGLARWRTGHLLSRVCGGATAMGPLPVTLVPAGCPAGRDRPQVSVAVGVADHGGGLQQPPRRDGRGS